MDRELGEGNSASDIDRVLLSFCDKRWQKVAKIIGNTIRAFEDRGVANPGTAGPIEARLAALIASGRIEAKGDSRRWRYSELRLPP